MSADGDNRNSSRGNFVYILKPSRQEGQCGRIDGNSCVGGSQYFFEVFAGKISSDDVMTSQACDSSVLAVD